MKKLLTTILFCVQFLQLQAQLEIRFNVDYSSLNGNGRIHDTLLVLPGPAGFSPGLGIEYSWNNWNQNLRTGILIQHFSNQIKVEPQNPPMYRDHSSSTSLEFFRFVVPIGVDFEFQKVLLTLNLLPSIRLGKESIAIPNSSNNLFVESQSRTSLGIEGLVSKYVGRRVRLALYYKTYITKTLKRSDSIGSYNFRERGLGFSIFYRFKKYKNQKSHNTRYTQ